MAWPADNTTDLSAAEIALAAADKTLIAANNALEDYQSCWWNRNGDFTDGNGNEAHTDYPVIRSVDRLTHLVTKPDAARNTWYLMWELEATPDDIDCVFILNHNFGTIGGLTVSFEVDALQTFATAIELASWTPGTSNKRLADLSLGHPADAAPNRYDGVAYARLKITKGAGHTPEIGEVLVMRRRQLKHDPNHPWDDVGLRSESEDFISRSGVITRHVFHRGRRDIAATINPHETAYKNDIISWFSETNYGNKPFVWVDQPNAAPSDFNLMMLTDPAIDFPAVGPHEREISIVAREQGPHFLELGV